MRGFVSLVGAGPGEPDLITLRGYRVLKLADVVLYDALVDPEMLEGIKGQRVYVGKRCGKHTFTQPEIAQLMVRFARAGKRVVRLKGGDPTLLGRGGEEARALVSAGIPFEMVPGVTSALSVPAAAGIPVTFRGISEGVTVVTAHRRDDAPDFAIPSYDPRRTLVLLMGVRTAPDWTGQMGALGYPAGLPVAFVSRGCSIHQQVVVGVLGDIADKVKAAELQTPALAVVGEVVRLRDELAWHHTDLKPLLKALGE